MAVAFVSEFDVDPGDRSTPVYDAVNARLDPVGDPPEGLIVHTAGFAEGDVFRIFDVWESGAHAQRFYEGRLASLLEEVQREQGVEGTPPARRYSYDLHDLITF